MVAVECNHKPETLDTVNGWRTCDRMSELPEGEQIMGSEMQKRLKWRVIDLHEDTGVKGGPYDGVPKTGITFRDATVEIVQAIPLSL